jgi:hypothetical protein
MRGRPAYGTLAACKTHRRSSSTQTARSGPRESRCGAPADGWWVDELCGRMDSHPPSFWGRCCSPHRPALRADRARARRACGPCSARGGGARGAVRAGPLPPPAPRGAAPVNGRLRTGRQGHCTGREGHPAVGRRRSRQPNHSKKITVNPPAPLAPGIHMTAPRDGSRGGRPADRPRASSSTPKLGDSQRTERGARDPPRRSVVRRRAGHRKPAIRPSAVHQTRHGESVMITAIVGVAVTEIATLRAELSGSQVG